MFLRRFETDTVVNDGSAAAVGIANAQNKTGEGPHSHWCRSLRRRRT